MSLRSTLVEQLRRFDEDAFIALANRGLLRRATKDLEAAPPTIVDESADALTIAVGEQRVLFTAQGLARAKCSCPAATVCQHILTAALWLQREASVEATVGATEVATADSQNAAPAQQGSAPDTAGLHDALMRFDQTQLAKYAGKPGYRWAWQFVQDLVAEKHLRLGSDRNIQIGFLHPPITFRYMGGDLDSLIADASLPKIEKYRVAAVLAYQRAHGVEPRPLETKPQTGSLDLGKDHALAEAGESYLREARVRLRAATRQLLLECVELGLSHLSASIQERFEMLATWAQSAEYPRLALMLRRIADHVELLLERAAGADEQRLFDEATIAYGLIEALETADRSGSAPRHLVGTARNRYESVPTLELYGLGAFPWRSGSGYVGLTMLFWSPTVEGFLTCTDARPETLRTFNPVARYVAAGPWSGLGAPAQTTGRRILLTNAQISATGRISANDKTSAVVQSVDAGELIRHLVPVSSWQEINESRAAARQSLLAQPDPTKDWIALRPTTYGRAAFDANRQTLIWPLFDAAGNRLDAEIPYSEFTEHAIKRIEAHAGGANADALVIVKLRNRASELVADPLSIVSSDPANPVDALHFDAAPAQGLLSKLFTSIVPQRSATVYPSEQGRARPTALTYFREALLRSSERGVAGVTNEGGLPVYRVRHTGFSVFRSLKGNDAAFKANYIYLQLASLAGVAQGVEEE